MTEPHSLFFTVWRKKNGYVTTARISVAQNRMKTKRRTIHSWWFPVAKRRLIESVLRGKNKFNESSFFSNFTGLRMHQVKFVEFEVIWSDRQHHLAVFTSANFTWSSLKYIVAFAKRNSLNLFSCLRLRSKGIFGLRYSRIDRVKLF